MRAAFELDETETAALVGAHEARAAAEPRVVNPVAGQEPMPIWVIPLLVTAVSYDDRFRVQSQASPRRCSTRLMIHALPGPVCCQPATKSYSHR